MPPKRKLKSGKEATETKDPEEDAQAEIRHDGSSSIHSVPRPLGLTSEDIQAALSRYQHHITQLAESKEESKLQELDNWRLKDLPELIKSRSPAHVEKRELERLMEWKLARGKFRPTLPALIAQNTPAKVKSSTQEAFSSLSDIEPSTLPYQPFRILLKSLCGGLKGVGPATGSLLLSIYDDRVPFMSDEAYIWVMYADKGTKTRDIKYTEKGYLDYAVRMWGVAEKADITPTQLEQVAWVLGWEWISGIELRPTAKSDGGPERDNEEDGPPEDIPDRPKRSKRQKR
ncbi:hypothetical protein BN14_00759 [Rhizoctonia solani AG-1 IB]|uniref:Uncharacterized protein n=1 Tax=Thanatephorus cucumeris (strain AG1-IB / isolate 7/3/14) TaxID=1108050 RepID=M5BI69_THACB|nr:hypothetical protein BN14_00759 [Rhizoctonia solani AG-1 IB]